MVPDADSWMDGSQVLLHYERLAPIKNLADESARSNLEDPAVKKEYERGYKILLDWFHENL
jgi:hypothetical protein